MSSIDLTWEAQDAFRRAHRAARLALDGRKHYRELSTALRVALCDPDNPDNWVALKAARRRFDISWRRDIERANAVPQETPRGN